jgi:hypothetical protein
VPLHAEHPRSALVLLIGNDQLDRLDESILGPAGDREAVAESIHALMVMGGTRQSPRLRHGGETAPRCRRDLVDRQGPLDGNPVLDQPGDVGEVGMERPAERDVHQLHPSADAEGRHRESISGVEQIDLELVPVRLDAVEVFVRSSPVPRGVDVATPDEEQAVERLEGLLGCARLTGSDDRGSRARSPEGIEVERRNPVSALRPAGDAVAGEVIRDDGDQRSVRDLGHVVECSDGLRSGRQVREALEHLTPAALVRGHEPLGFRTDVFRALAPLRS